MSKQKILSLLNQSEGYLSGAEMSRQLGISRAAISKAVESLRQEGYEIDAVTNRGYKLVDAPDRQQTGGRGRLGRSFASPEGKGIYYSVLLRPDLPPAEAVNLTAYVAVAVCNGIEEATGVRPQIKWTNDIVMNGRKVCGILTEMAIEGETAALQYIVTGIGVNVNQTAEDWPEELKAIAGSIAQAVGHPVRRGRLAACLLNALDRVYLDWLAGNHASYLEQYRKDCLTVGREVKLLRSKSGFAGMERCDTDIQV